jgi:hypothetical protein
LCYLKDCADDEECRVINGKARCVPSCHKVHCDVPTEVCSLHPVHDCPQCFPVPRCHCPDNERNKYCPEATCQTCPTGKVCKQHPASNVCGACATATCEDY